MGIAIARAAWRRGADVTLIAGHVDVPIPQEITSVAAATAHDMAAAVSQVLPETDVLVMAAAPADFRPAEAAAKKIKKGREIPNIELEHTDDILKSTIKRRKDGSFIVGFALETNDGLVNAREKMKSKELDLVVLNDATEPGAGFGVDTNRVTLISKRGKEEDLPLMSKTELAEVLLDRIEEELGGR
jgi:phosphopantothenoylcysteine decarboxylase/phosphopantothenate--cysteine ligase